MRMDRSWLLVAALLAEPMAGCGGDVDGEPGELAGVDDGIESLDDIDPLAATSCTQIANLPAANMPTKTFGNSCWAECWNLWGNGYIEQTVTFPAAGSYQFVISAKGMKALNVWPNMELRVDQQRVGSTFVTTTAPASYVFTVNVSAGAHRVAVAFTNNYDSAYEQRNLLVHRTTISRCSTTTDPQPEPEPQPQPGNLQLAVDQNTRSKNVYFPYGVPESWDWYAGKISVFNGPPEGFTAFTGWGVVYPQKFAPNVVNPSARYEVARYKVYFHRRTGGWVLAQSQATANLAGANFAADFTAKPLVPWLQTNLADRTVQIGLPPLGYTSHWWTQSRVTTSPDVDGCFVRADMRVTDGSVNMVAQLGADWWRDLGAPFLPDFSNNPTAGAGNWVKLGTNWTPISYYSVTEAQFRADPPPLD
ncbi:MAG: carbohydrate-binding domain-containing protein [Myxococcota bacterium]